MYKINQKSLATISGGYTNTQCYAAGLAFVFGGILVSSVLWGTGVISSCWNS